MNTENILFICGGAFVGLEGIIRKRLGASTLGFASIEEGRNTKEYTEEEVLAKTLPEDLFLFGMIPELVGRLPIFAPLTTLTEDELAELLTKPKNALVKQYAKLLAMNGIKLTVEESALRAMARLAIERGTGARALRSICWTSCTRHRETRALPKWYSRRMPCWARRNLNFAAKRKQVDHARDGHRVEL